MTTMGYNTEELKRKLDVDESQQGGPIQKILKRSNIPSTEQLSDIFSQTQFSLAFEEDDEDDFDLNSDFNDSNDDHLNQMEQMEQEQQPDQQQQKEEQQKPQQPAPPQRKKPGRKPNPASPALRKAQNRAAQRAFRERKERHLRELENTIKSLREDQYESLIKHQRETSHYQRESSHYRSLIEQLEAENSFLKQVAFTFECALNNINGNNDATTKLKNAVSLSNATRASSLQPLNGGANGIIGSPFGLGSMQMRQAVTLPSQQSVPTAQQIQNTFLGLLDVNNVRGTSNLNISSPATSNVMLSPNSGNMSTTTVSTASSPPTPESTFPPSTFFAEEFAREITLADMKPFVTSSPMPLFMDCNENNYNTSDPTIFKSGIDLTSSQSMSKSNSNSSTVSSGSNTTNSLNNDDGSPSFMAEAASMIDNDADFFSALIFNDDLGPMDNDESKQLFSNFDFNNANDFDITKRRLNRDHEQTLRLSKKIGQTIPAPVMPKTRYPLTHQQKYFLTLEHDPRIAMIPCLHLRSRMIQHRDQYDLYELVELLINKAKCHGDPLDPDAWELPEEFFERYGVLVFQHCRIKSDLYKKYGRLPKDFNNFYKKGSHLIS